MKKSFIFGYSLFAAIAAAASWASHAFTNAASAVVAFVVSAFPASAPPEFAFAMASAPRVTGLHQTRAFHQRLLDHSGDGRRRAPLSSAFTASA